MYRKAQITVIEGMSAANQWCVPDSGPDDFVDFDRSLSSFDAELSDTSNNIRGSPYIPNGPLIWPIGTTVFAVPEVNLRKDENQNNFSTASNENIQDLEDESENMSKGNDRCDVQCYPMSLVHEKKIKYSQLTDIDCLNSVKRFCISKELEHTENVQNARCCSHIFPAPEVHTNSSHFYAPGTTINTLLSQVINLPTMAQKETIDFETKSDSAASFQYVLMAPTSSATKLEEEPVTYLNQGQSYEIKVRKAGDFADLRGKIYKSIIQMGFQERRLQYIEKEQIMEWQLQRPMERIIEIDVPLTYGVIESCNSAQNINKCEFLWDPTKDIGIFLKVNCISTEFTPKKHGGEKGVPFRILIETYAYEDPLKRLHGASCQVKVFKPKGADRKHKTEREKLHKRPQGEKEKYHPRHEISIFKNVTFNDSWLSAPIKPSPHSTTDANSSPTSSHVGMNQYSPSDSLVQDSSLEDISYQDTPTTYTDEVPDISTLNSESLETYSSHIVMTPSSSNTEVARWLEQHFFNSLLREFANFTGSDLINLKRRDLIDICGLASGIRMFNLLHPRPAYPCLTIYVRLTTQEVFQAIYFKSYEVQELEDKLKKVFNIPSTIKSDMFVCGPTGIHVIVTKEVIQNMAEESIYIMELIDDHYHDGLRILLTEVGGRERRKHILGKHNLKI